MKPTASIVWRHTRHVCCHFGFPTSKEDLHRINIREAGENHTVVGGALGLLSAWCPKILLLAAFVTIYGLVLFFTGKVLEWWKE